MNPRKRLFALLLRRAEDVQGGFQFRQARLICSRLPVEESSLSQSGGVRQTAQGKAARRSQLIQIFADSPGHLQFYPLQPVRQRRTALTVSFSLSRVNSYLSVQVSCNSAACRRMCLI